MLTPEEVTAGTARLTANKLKNEDADKMASIFRRVFAGIEQREGWNFLTELQAVTDAGNDLKQAAQIAACLAKLEELGFAVGELTGSGRSGLKLSEKELSLEYVLYAFSKLHPIPQEFSGIDLRRLLLTRSKRGSSAARVDRIF